MRVAAGFLMIVGGILGFLLVLILHADGVYGAVIVTLSFLAVIGGLVTCERINWYLALIGAICALFASLICGIPALIFLIKSKDEFSMGKACKASSQVGERYGDG